MGGSRASPSCASSTSSEGERTPWHADGPASRGSEAPLRYRSRGAREVRETPGEVRRPVIVGDLDEVIQRARADGEAGVDSLLCLLDLHEKRVQTIERMGST